MAVFDTTTTGLFFFLDLAASPSVEAEQVSKGTRGGDERFRGGGENRTRGQEQPPEAWVWAPGGRRVAARLALDGLSS